jgi:hypothetical protein
MGRKRQGTAGMLEGILLYQSGREQAKYLLSQTCISVKEMQEI